MHGKGPCPLGGMWTITSLSIGSPSSFSKWGEENVNLSKIPLMGSKEWAGMNLRWAS